MIFTWSWINLNYHTWFNIFRWVKQVALFPHLSSEMTKYIVVSGGVISGIGKGVIGVYSFMISKTGQKTQDISE